MATKQKTSYERVVFLQGEEAEEPLKILDEEGREAALEFLAQWDNGDGGDIHSEPASGTDDDVYQTKDGYRMSYNTHLGYIGLERIIRE